MLDKIVFAGGSGYLGHVLSDYFKDRSKEIIILSRRNYASSGNIHYDIWDGKTAGAWTRHLENADLLINLSGKNVNCRYTKKNREEIIRSRLEPTSLLGQAIAGLKAPPKTWINFASATIYRNAEDHYQDEDKGEIGTGFSVDVCKVWEKSFWEAKTPQTKKILLRVGIVFGKSDGMIPRVKSLAKYGLGGHQGNGRQYISWIHEHDLARITEWLYQQGNDGEIYNCTSPVAIQNKDFMKLVRQMIGVPVGLPAPQWLLELGAIFIGTETELILKSRWVYPRHLLDKGFLLQFPDPEQALRNVFNSRA
jgi:uncharacterized protein (TIGR01777 family)